MKRACEAGLLMLMLGLGGCMSVPPTSTHQPMSARAPAREAPVLVGGSIFSAAGQRSLFDDRRAHRVGDTLTVNLVERTQAAKNASTSSNRATGVTAGIPTMTHIPLGYLRSLDLSASSDNKLKGEGSSAADNAFTGTITVTVIDVLPNGNLVVSGEKQLAINQGEEFIRMSGVVNPIFLTTSNTVNSTQVADAKIEYKGSGFIDEAQRMGWLARFFQYISPF